MANENRRKRVLVQTVGTGNIDDTLNTLITPMLESIEDGEWHRVVLLPSRISERWARQLRERVQDAAVDIFPLPKENQENNADECFKHFDHVFSRIIEQGFATDQIIADFTRGTKAMSAALVLAAVRRDIQTLRYVYGMERDKRGMVVPGSEIVGKFPTSLVSARRRLDLAIDLMRRGDFGAVATLIPDTENPFARLWPDDLRKEAEGLRIAAKCYGAWDRFDYKDALSKLRHLTDTTAAVPAELRPGDAITAWIERLDREPERSEMPLYATWLRAVACDLLANAERRLRDRHMEDALIRAYRIVELVGQCRLFDQGYDSGKIPSHDPAIKQFRQKLEKGKSQGFEGDGLEFLKAPRIVVARLLKYLGDSLAKRLLDFDNEGAAKANSRNHSILIHGFTASAPSEKDLEDLRKLLQRLECLLVDDDPEARQRLTAARWLNFRPTR